MKAILILITMTGTAINPPMPPEIARERWHDMTHVCWEGTNKDGEPVSETVMKVACITAGVLTQRLVDAGYCLDGKKADWKPC